MFAQLAPETINKKQTIFTSRLNKCHLSMVGLEGRPPTKSKLVGVGRNEKRYYMGKWKFSPTFFFLGGEGVAVSHYLGT